MKFASPFAAPKPRKKPTVKRYTDEEQAERNYVRARDRGCVARMFRLDDGTPLTEISPCYGHIEVDHVRASGGLGMKSITHRTNLASLCLHHHKLKTEWGKTWRPLLIEYLERVEGAA